MRITAKQAKAMGIVVPKTEKTKASVKETASCRKAMFFSMCLDRGLPKPEPEHKFAKELGRNWAFDFAWTEYLVALEQEGGLYGRGKPCPTCKRKAPGAHSSIDRMLRDMEKYREAAILGWRVIRCTPQEIESGEACQLVLRAITTKQREM